MKIAHWVLSSWTVATITLWRGELSASRDGLIFCNFKQNISSLSWFISNCDNILPNPQVSNKIQLTQKLTAWIKAPIREK